MCQINPNRSTLLMTFNLMDHTGEGVGRADISFKLAYKKENACHPERATKWQMHVISP